jgi:hypothetical protein
MFLIDILIGFCIHIPSFQVDQNDMYFHGTNKFDITSYVTISGDEAIVEIIYYQKFPRKLLVDSLKLNSSKNKYIGIATEIVVASGNYILMIREDSSKSFKSVSINLNEIPHLETRRIESLKKDALWNDLYSHYREKGLSAELIRLKSQELGVKKSLSYSEFIYRIGQLKEKLDECID